MDEQFESRQLIPLERLRELQTRDDASSAIRLALHLAAFIALIMLLVGHADAPLTAFLLAVALAWVWSGLFAPFHECTHQTAFRSRTGNRIGVWLTGIPFLMAPAVYRTFHFEHHRHTQDPDKDPELQNDPRYLHWPTGWSNWLTAASGMGLLRLKLVPLFGFALRAQKDWHEFAPWADKIHDPVEIVRDTMIVLMSWVFFVVACVLWIPGGWWLLFAAWFTHVFQTLWISAEHTGLPTAGTILDRTRTVTSNTFVRFWIWNMNYHAEHHAWPGLPWHQLPAAHREVAHELGSFVPGYAALHRNVINAVGTPSCDTPA